jgi:hypothetical protein
MSIPKLTNTEHLAVLVAAGGLTLLVAPAVVPASIKWLAFLGGLLIGGGSFVLRQGWKPSISP